VTVAEQILALAGDREEETSLAELIAKLDAESDIPIAAFATMAEIVRVLTGKTS
jgi:type III secretion system FlhB-like substrate exporter